MVYSLISRASAAVATVIGSSWPELLTPSVSRVTSLLFESESFSILAAVAMPLPICRAVFDSQLVRQVHVTQQTKQDIMVQGGRTLDESLLRENDQPYTVVLPLLDELGDYLLGCCQPVRDEVRLPHAAGYVQGNGDVHTLAPYDLTRIRYLGPGRGDNHQRKRQEPQRRDVGHQPESQRPSAS